MKNEISEFQHRLENEDIRKLILKFAIPAIISGLVTSLYNIVDQIFIGQSVGMLGNAATNVAFPLVNISIALALLVGVGSASNFSLEMGRGNPEKAKKIISTGIFSLIAGGIIISVVSLIFLEPLLRIFGATTEVLPYAISYTGITAIGIPFYIMSTGGNHLIRADGSPKYAMKSILSGAILNLILDPIFIFGFDMGIQGAALATIIGQMVSGIMAGCYFFKFKTFKLDIKQIKFNPVILKAIASLGIASGVNQSANMLVQITMNNTLTHYGAMSVYGSEIPLAVVGVISKVNIIIMAIVIGFSQGTQPIVGFNYGKKNYNRVMMAYKTNVTYVIITSVVAFLCFQLFPRQIVSAFGAGSELYFEFAVKYFRIFLFFVCLNGIQPVTSNFFTSIGKAKVGVLISLTRQVMFLLPLIVILPLFMGIKGAVYAGPISDLAAIVLAIYLINREFKIIKEKNLYK